MTLRESTKIATAVALCLLPSWILVLNTARGLSEPHIHSSVVCGNKIVGSGSGGDLMGMLDAIIQGYRRETDWRLRTCDTVVALAGIVALLQVAYLYLVKSSPFNSFIGGFFSALGTAVLTIVLRMQLDPANKALFLNIQARDAVLQYALAIAVLHVAVVMYGR